VTRNATISETPINFIPRILVIGVGGGGGNAVDNMIALDLQGGDFVIANTDAQQLRQSRAARRIQLGPRITQGFGAGAKPEIGRLAAEETADELHRHLDGAHMVFITAGMGGGTGTGAAPVIARIARERSILTVGVVTKPFNFEGSRRARAADAGIEELQQYVDTLIVIPNQNLFRVANERTTWKEAFKIADHVLYMGVRGVTDLMMAPGLVNLDFADIRTVMAEMGKAMMGMGEAEGENRAISAAEAAIGNPLLEDTRIAGARGLLINITGGDDLTLFEVDQAANRIREEVGEQAKIIFGTAIDEGLSGRIRVSVVATGIDMPAVAEATKPVLSVLAPASRSSGGRRSSVKSRPF
jgi:cell division protein FtsZ